MKHLIYLVYLAIFISQFYSEMAFAQKYNFKTYGLEDGLVQSQIPSIIQDNDGNMWFGTFGGGVSKFNGQSFQNYNTTDGLSNNDIRTMLVDRHGNLWFATREGLSKLYLNNKSRCLSNEQKTTLCIEIFNIKNGMADDFVESIFEDSKGNIWIAYWKHGIAKLSYVHNNDPKAKNIINNEVVILNYNTNNGLADSTTRDITEDKYGNIWIATTSGVSKLPFGYLEKLTKGKDTIFENLIIGKNKSYNSVLTILIDSKENLWCGTRKGIGIFLPKDKNSSINPKDTSTYEMIKLSGDEGLASYSIYAMLEDKDGNIWMGTRDNGLFKVTLDLENKKIKVLDYFTTNNGLPENQIWSLCEDREGNIWIGTSGGGVARYSGKMFEAFTTEDGLAHNVIWNILQDKNGNFWFRPYYGGISVYDPKVKADYYTLQNQNKKKIISYSKKEGLKHNVVQSWFKDSKGDIWVGTRAGGVSKISINQRNRTIKTVNPFGKNDSIADRLIYVISEDRSGAMWFAAARKLFKYKDRKFTPILKEDGLIFNSVDAILEDSKGNMWFLTRQGVSRLMPPSDADTAMNFKSYTTKEGLVTDYMIAIIEDNKGNIWLGGQGGVSVYNHQADTFYNFTIKDNLSSDMIYLIIQDDNGYIWIGTNKGIDRVSYEDGKITVKKYGKPEGFIGIETNSEAAYKDNEGNIWFGTIKGVTKYNPNEDKENTMEPLTHITDMRLFFEEVDWSDFADSLHPKTSFPVGLQLLYNQNHLTFDFIGISLTIPEKVKYQWKLKGFDKKWAPVTSKHEATYSNIPPGEYTFMVKACNNDGVWNKKFTTFSFVIKPPFWQTLWFYFSCGISVFGIFFSYVKIKEKKLKKEKRILEEKVTERTKELSEANVVIEKKNKDISASINYAYRIQDAILPDEASFQKIFPDSFVLYKIKDIVSGDFPWLLQKGDDVFVTAVDCTGHGVPGAMLSMIGHFLLTEIIDSKNIHQPGTILTHLHEGVNKTLNQEVNIESRDGMDVAFCKINMKKMELEYAGAHRPLLHLTNGNINEIKGDGLPIGGVQYARRGKEMIFTNHIIKIKKGDAVYFYSDGYVDQFGGPEEKKIMSKRVREVILENKDKPMVEIGKTFEKIFVDWMGDNKQTDDVIFIGIRF